MSRYQPPSRLVDLVRLLVQHKIDKKVKTTEGDTARSLLVYRHGGIFYLVWNSMVREVLGILET